MRTRIALLAVSLALCIPHAAAGNLEFSKPETRDWSAVGFNEDGERVNVSREPDAASALRSVFIKCPGKCDFVVPYSTGVCVAIAATGRKPYAFFNEFSRSGVLEAEEGAMLRCRNRGGACRIAFSTCG